jgi:hypothetical protein
MLSDDLVKFRNLFLNDIAIQARIKAVSTNELSLKEAVKIAKENQLKFTVKQLKDAMELYALTGEGGDPLCGTAQQNTPPISPPTADELITLIRNTGNGKCNW